jgi:hypothetical protein
MAQSVQASMVVHAVVVRREETELSVEGQNLGEVVAIMDICKRNMSVL